MIENTTANTGIVGIRTDTGALLKDVSASIHIPEEQQQNVLRYTSDDAQVALRQALHQPLAYVARAYADMLETVAQYWQMQGAEAFVIWDEKLLFCWPPAMRKQVQAHEREDHMHWSPILLTEQVVGRIGIVGLDLLYHPELLVRMEADAAMIAQLVTLTAGLAETLHELAAHKQLKMEMELAASIQMHLLSQKPPQVKGLDLFARSLPALQIGGDFYSFYMSEQRPFIFTVGDVSGKGLKAALLMAMTRVVLDGAARFMPTVHPKALLNRVSEDLYDDFTELSMFATIFTGCYDPKSRQLSYANNGHSPVIYCPIGGPARLLEADGPAAGVLPFNLSENFTMLFEPGDVLVVATDGFNEAFNEQDEMFGYDRLLKLVEQLASYPAEHIASVLYEQVRQFSTGVEQNDDQTLVILKGVHV